MTLLFFLLQDGVTLSVLSMKNDLYLEMLLLDLLAL